MARILMVYATSEGQTKKISEFIKTQMANFGHNADIYNVDELSKALSIANYDAVIVGAAVRFNKYPTSIKNWIKAHAEELSRKPSAFFSVCMGIAHKDKNVHIELRKNISHFFYQTQWTPSNWTIFAGALAYSRYNWFLKFVMRQISKSGGLDTDTSKDYEYTDWNEVSRFARRFAESLPISPVCPVVQENQVLN